MTVSEHTPPCFLFSLSLAGRWGWGGIRWTRPTLLEDSFLPAIFSFWLKELDCKVLTRKKLCFSDGRTVRFLGSLCACCT
jgi:hypothetical protein